MMTLLEIGTSSVLVVGSEEMGAYGVSEGSQRSRQSPLEELPAPWLWFSL